MGTDGDADSDSDADGDSDTDSDADSDADADSSADTSESNDTETDSDTDSGVTDAGCSFDSDCEDGAFCELESCTGSPLAGSCMAKPEMCTMIYAPVCGCDGAEYSNECMAWAAGASTAPDARCNQ
ncbi:MAG: hypothetical protein JXX29_16855 [Deltaproteobacteria bacterium]|nr:hypothetical protein [Deltaproteobacteria bacterium]MBN2673356.1 hypothetical protein [Deltaproteobacteria bacterium]